MCVSGMWLYLARGRFTPMAMLLFLCRVVRMLCVAENCSRVWFARVTIRLVM